MTEGSMYHMKSKWAVSVIKYNNITSCLRLGGKGLSQGSRLDLLSGIDWPV